MRYKLISCEILYREVCHVTARARHQIDLEFLPKQLHDIGHEKMRQKLDEAINQVDTSQYDAILLGYGLCNNGVIGLQAGSVPMVIPRAHDCITLFLGSQQKYLDYFHAHPGAYYLTSGWIERGSDWTQTDTIMQHQCGMGMSYQDLVEKYGEANAAYLQEQLGDLTRNYNQITYIRMGIEPDDRFETQANQEAQKRGWSFETLTGDLRLLQNLVDGHWNPDDYVVIQPGERLSADYSGCIMGRKKSHE